mgnify:CR=1 FL=1
MNMIVDGHIETLSADGDSAEVDVIGPAYVHLSGTFDSGTAKIQFKGSDGTWRDVAGASYAAAADKVVDFPPRSQNTLRVNLNGSTSPALVVGIKGER